MQASDFKGLYAIIPTPAVPGSDALSAKNTIALDETERLVNNLIRDGADGLIILGTTGECATLSAADFRAFVDCVCRTVDKRTPLVVGATALGGHEVFDRLSFLKAQGADATMLGLPMWQPCTLDMAVGFYSDVSEAFPDLPVMVYANARAFRFSFPTEFWAAVARNAPSVVSAKSSHARDLARNIAETSGRIHFMPSDMVANQFFEISPETTTSCWATAAAMGPEPAKALIDAINRNNISEANRLGERIAWTNQPIQPILADQEGFASYNIQVEKTRIAEAGYCIPGPVRPPYNHFPENYAELSRDCGRRWVELRRELSVNLAN